MSVCYIFIYELLNNSVIGSNCTVLNNVQCKWIENSVKETVVRKVKILILECAWRDWRKNTNSQSGRSISQLKFELIISQITSHTPHCLTTWLGTYQYSINTFRSAVGNFQYNVFFSNLLFLESDALGYDTILFYRLLADYPVLPRYIVDSRRELSWSCL
jgi:hypothetical protein